MTKKSSLGWFSVTASSVAVVLVALLVARWSMLSNPSHESTVNGGWEVDEEFLNTHQNDEDTCDFPVIQAKVFYRKRQANIEGLFDHPFVVRGMTSTWPAHERWSKANFTKFYGHRSVKMGSESSIVYGGGSAVLTATLNDVVSRMKPYVDTRAPPSPGEDGVGEAGGAGRGTGRDGRDVDRSSRDVLNATDSFTFDVSVLKSIPELAADFKIPGIFSSWDSKETVQQGITWHMLSLGATRTGLPFHIHGETWLALIHGRKRWFVYPPGASAPLSVEQQFNPLRTVYDW